MPAGGVGVDMPGRLQPWRQVLRADRLVPPGNALSLGAGKGTKTYVALSLFTLFSSLFQDAFFETKNTYMHIAIYTTYTYVV